MPAAKPITVWLPLVAVEFRPGPLTDTEVAAELLHVIVDEPGAFVFVGFALIAALTFAGGAVTVNVAVRVTDPFKFVAVIV